MAVKSRKKVRTGRFSAIVTANRTGKVRHESMGGQEYMVVPMVMITNGVHSGNNGPLYYPSRELSDLPERWNHKPVVINHPTDETGESVSACTPKSVTKFGVGVIMNTRYDAKANKLRAEAWLIESRLKKIAPQVHRAILQSKIVEVSTGLFSDNISKKGTWNGERFIGVARNYKPDHLAILTEGRGACSVADGAGLLQLNKASEFPNVVEIGGKAYVMPSRQTKNSKKKGTANMTAKQKRIQAAKKKLVEGLVSNKKSGWSEEDRQGLMGFKLSKLKDITANIAKQRKEAKKKVVVNEDDDEEEDEEDDASSVDDKGGKKKVVANKEDDKGGDKKATKNKKVVSLDDWLDEHNAPEPLRRMISNSVEFEKKTRTRLIKTILANSEANNGPWTEKKLAKLDTSILNDLAATLNGRKKVDDDDDEDDEELEIAGLDYSGRGFALNEDLDDDDEEDEDDDEAAYLPPSTFNAKLFANKNK